MKIILGTSNLNKRPGPSTIRGTGARLTQKLAERASPAHESSPAEVDVKQVLQDVQRENRAVAKRPKPGTKLRLPNISRKDPLAWAKAAASMREWKQKKESSNPA